MSNLCCFYIKDVDRKFVKVSINVYTEFSEMSRKEVKEYETKFKA
jgi:hypothetical protein